MGEETVEVVYRVVVDCATLVESIVMEYGFVPASKGSAVAVPLTTAMLALDV